MKTPKQSMMWLAAMAAMIAGGLAAEPPTTPPDLTQDNAVDRTLTYNLGSTGMRGWIYTRPAVYLDSAQGRTTAASRQILVTHVGANSPAAGVMEVNDVILGAGGKLFSDDARKSLGVAIGAAETEASKGVLKLTRWRAGQTAEVQLKLKVMGSYSPTAPYECKKSALIFDDACKLLAKEPLSESWAGAINGLAMLATGKPEFLPKLREYAHKLAPATLNFRAETNGSAWELGYQGIFLCEYYLLTGDKDVLHGINEYTALLARGQGMYGTFGHGFSELTAAGKPHGSIPPYGPVNAAGLPANIAIVMGKMCGVKDPEVDPAIDRASKFFGYYVDKGAIPYGEHLPWPYHENNGKNSMTAVLFALQGNQNPQTHFFAQMATAGYANREYGHTGQGFSYLWGALGANAGGPAAAAAFFKQAAWHFDLVRRCDGSFTYDGGEQYGAGRTDDDTYYGSSSYSGLSPLATYVLTYSMPLKNLCITGKNAAPANFLSKAQVAAAIASGRFDLDRTQMTPPQLVAAFGDWSPIVRGWAAEELAKRPEAKTMVPQLLTLAEGKDAHLRQGACETLGYLKDASALPVLIRLLKHDDRWLRVKAANALRDMGNGARPVLPDMLTAVAATAEPLQPIGWNDPVQLAQGALAEAMFKRGLLSRSINQMDRRLLYPALQTISRNADGMARALLRDVFENLLTLEDVTTLAPDILAAIDVTAPADTMFGNEIRMGGLAALAKYQFKEAIPVAVKFARTQSGHGSESRTGVIMKALVSYGTAARGTIPELKELIEKFNTELKNHQFPKDCNDQRVASVEAAIRAIEAATTQPQLRSIKPAS